MVLFGNRKYACINCIRGHRSSLCEHRDRILLQVRRPGRRSQADLQSRYVLVWKESSPVSESPSQYKLVKVPEKSETPVDLARSNLSSAPPLEDDDEVVVTDKYIFVHVGENMFRRDIRPDFDHRANETKSQPTPKESPRELPDAKGREAKGHEHNERTRVKTHKQHSTPDIHKREYPEKSFRSNESQALDSMPRDLREHGSDYRNTGHKIRNQSRQDFSTYSGGEYNVDYSNHQMQSMDASNKDYRGVTTFHSQGPQHHHSHHSHHSQHQIQHPQVQHPHMHHAQQQPSQHIQKQHYPYDLPHGMLDQSNVHALSQLSSPGTERSTPLHEQYASPQHDILKSEDIYDPNMDPIYDDQHPAPMVIGPMQLQQDGQDCRETVMNELGITEEEASQIWPQSRQLDVGQDFSYAAQCVLPGQCQCGEGCECADCFEHRSQHLHHHSPTQIRSHHRAGM